MGEGPGRDVDKSRAGGIASVETGYYLALSVDPPRSLFP